MSISPLLSPPQHCGLHCITWAGTSPNDPGILTPRPTTVARKCGVRKFKLDNDATIHMRRDFQQCHDVQPEAPCREVVANLNPCIIALVWGRYLTKKEAQAVTTDLNLMTLPLLRQTPTILAIAKWCLSWPPHPLTFHIFEIVHALFPKNLWWLWFLVRVPAWNQDKGNSASEAILCSETGKGDSYN
jgi:hypothetical protein